MKSSLLQLSCSLFMFVILGLVVEAQTCSPMAYEGFIYDSLTPLHTSGGGSGWDGTWIMQNEDATVPGYNAVSNSLTYLDLQNNGNACGGGSVWLTAGRRLNTDVDGPFGAYRVDEYTNAIGLPGTTIWMSALLRKTNANEHEVFVDLHDDEIITYSHAPRVSMGYFGAFSDFMGQPYWSLRINDTVYRSNVLMVPGQTALLVASVQFGANDNNTVELYVNPTDMGDEMPVSPDVSQAFTYPMQFRAMTMYLGYQYGEGYADEIRIADSYRCATPDAAVPVNNPPVVNFTASITDGNAPLTVTFDASGSTDDGTIVDYEWVLGDGQTVSDMVGFSHLYEAIGVLPVTLTCIDNLGASASMTINIIVRDENGDLPCLTNLGLSQPASCGQNNGAIYHYYGMGDSFTLTAASDGTVYNSVGDLFSNLPAGEYTFAASGQYACTESVTVYVPTDSTTCAGWQRQNCNMQIGMGLAGVAYWNQERAFKNFVMASSEWIPYHPDSAHWNSGYIDEFAFDAQGYPTHIPQSTSIGMQNIRLYMSAADYILPGDYLLLYDGVGTIQFFGDAGITSQTPGRIAFTTIGDFWFEIVQSQLGDHIRNIRIVRPEHEFDDLTQPFYEPFLAHLDNFSAIRFMDWGETNNSHQVAWSQRTLPDFYTQAGNGVAYEYMIQLCNILQKDLWVCVPHGADEDYMRQMARLFRDNLSSNLNVYLEYSNEVWNWQFEQTHWVNERRPLNLSYNRAYGERCKQLFAIWMEEYGGDNHRVKRVAGTQATFALIGEGIMAQLGPDNFDYLSPTWYFGYGDPCEQDLWNLGAAATPQDVIDCAIGLFRNNSTAYRQDYWNAQLYGKEVINYEGGQHMTSNPVITTFQQATYDAQIAPEIYNAYQEVLDSVRTWGSKLAMAFILASTRESEYGSWGHLEQIDQNTSTQPAPKYDALLDNVYAPCQTLPSARLLRVRALLEGAFDENTGLMRTNLAEENLLPLQQPYNTTPWNYEGYEKVNRLPDDVTDWVLVELRSAADPNEVVFRKAALLRNDGRLLDVASVGNITLDGVVLPASLPNDSYFVAVRHRNHLDVMSNATIAITTAPTALVDLSVPANVMEGNPQLVQLSNGDYALLAGDYNGDGVISVFDYNGYVSEMSLMNVYLPGDFNLDTAVTVHDYNLLLGHPSAIGVTYFMD